MTRSLHRLALAALPAIALLAACGGDTTGTASDDGTAFSLFLDGCNGHTTDDLGYHYHAYAAAENNILTCFTGATTLLGAACGTDDQSRDPSTAAGLVEGDTTTDETASPSNGTYEIEVWADSWMAVYVSGDLIGKDSVSITTERSFNAETFTLDATEPFTVAIEAKDFKETEAGSNRFPSPCRTREPTRGRSREHLSPRPIRSPLTPASSVGRSRWRSTGPRS